MPSIQRLVDAARSRPRLFFLLGLGCNVLYIIISLLFHTLLFPGQYGDMKGTWIPAVDSYLTDIDTLYDNVTCPFKNVPQIVYLLMLLYYLPGGLVAQIFAFSLAVLVVSVGTFVVARKNYQLVGKDSTTALILASLGMMITAQAADHIYSQFNLFAGLCVVLSFYFMLKGNEKLQFFFLGLSIMFKHITIFMVPIILLFQGKLNMKNLLERLVFIALPLIPSAIMFLLHPHLITAIIEANTNAIVDINNSLVFAGSLTKFLSLYTPLSPVAALVVVGAAGYGLFIVAWRKRRLDTQDLYIAGAFVTMLVSPEFYGQHHGIFYFFIVLWLIKYPKRYLAPKLIIIALISTLHAIPLTSVAFLAIFLLEKIRERTGGKGGNDTGFETSPGAMVPHDNS